MGSWVLLYVVFYVDVLCTSTLTMIGDAKKSQRESRWIRQRQQNVVDKSEMDMRTWDSGVEKDG